MDFRLVMSDSCGSYLDHPVELVAELLGEQAGEHGAQDLAHADPKGHPWQNKNDWIIQCCTTKSIPERKKHWKYEYLVGGQEVHCERLF